MPSIPDGCIQQIEIDAFARVPFCHCKAARFLYGEQRMSDFSHRRCGPRRGAALTAGDPDGSGNGRRVRMPPTWCVPRRSNKFTGVAAPFHYLTLLLQAVREPHGSAPRQSVGLLR
jgi:hypothetical protein